MESLVVLYPLLSILQLFSSTPLLSTSVLQMSSTFHAVIFMLSLYLLCNNLRATFFDWWCQVHLYASSVDESKAWISF